MPQQLVCLTETAGCLQTLGFMRMQKYGSVSVTKRIGCTAAACCCYACNNLFVLLLKGLSAPCLCAGVWMPYIAFSNLKYLPQVGVAAAACTAWPGHCLHEYLAAAS
jgi:hypothetical protein